MPTASRGGTANLRPFKPGQSGNPSGRPKGTGELARYIREQTLDGKELADWLLNLIRNPTGIKLVVRFDAVRELLDRGFGKPVQATELTGKDGAPLDVGIREIVVRLPAAKGDG